MSVRLERTAKFSVLSLDSFSAAKNIKLSDEAAAARFESLSREVSYETARNTSRLERASLPTPDAPNLTYGEVEYKSLAVILDKVRDEGGLDGKELVFVDLGSGCGRPIIAAGLLHPFHHLIGIEILDGLHSLALNLKDAWDAQQDKDELGLGEVEFVHGSILEHDWPERADVILANSTCFSIPFFADIERMARRCRPGTFFVSLTHCLGLEDRQAHWELVETLRLEMSWGAADVCVHRRR